MNTLQNKLEHFNQEISKEGWKAEANLDVPHEPIFQKGLELLVNKGDLLLAICLNNGYYNKENIYRMLRFALAFSKRVQIFFTDGPAKHNYRAMGEQENEVIRKSRLHRNRLRNHCIHGLERINIDLDGSKVEFLEWDNIYGDVAYQKFYAYLKALYQNNSDFEKDINETTRKVLENRMGIKDDNSSRLAVAIEYVLEELAFILAYPDLRETSKPIADHGTKGFNYMYYERWPVFENLVNGKYDSKVRELIGFCLVKV